jgi:3-hydroxyisobutyrate dehydrogenase
MTTIALIGTGIMGRGIAGNLKKAGHSLRLYGRNPEKNKDLKSPGVEVLDNAAEAARGSELVVLCLTTDDVLRATVLSEAFLSAASGTIVDVGTTSPELTLELHRAFKSRGANFLDAPMTGSKNAARDGQILFMTGGSDESFAAAKPLFDACAKDVVRCGEVGDGQRAKIALNMVQAGTLQVLLEGFYLARNLGISSDIFKRIIDQSAARSGISDFKIPFAIARNFETHFSLKNMNKDLNHALHLAMQTQTDLPLSFAVKQVFDRAMKLGHAEEDFVSISRTTINP